MNVQELIDELSKIEDKTLDVKGDEGDFIIGVSVQSDSFGYDIVVRWVELRGEYK